MAVPQRTNKADIERSEQGVLNRSFDEDFLTSVVQPLGYDGVNLQRQNASSLSLQIDYVGGTNPIYIGIAAPGTLTSAALWQVRKLTFDGNNNITVIKYAGGSPSFNAIYDNRTSLTYS